MPALIYFSDKLVASLFFISLMLIELLLEYGNYKKWRWAHFLFRIPSILFLRNKERQHNHFTVSGSIYVLMAAFLCTILFTKVIAIISLTVMLVSDSLAAIIGKAFGRHKIYKNKTFEGSFTFLLSALIITMLFNPVYTFSYASVVACILAAFMELFEQWLKIDDNVSIPLTIGIVLTVLA